MKVCSKKKSFCSHNSWTQNMPQFNINSRNSNDRLLSTFNDIDPFNDRLQSTHLTSSESEYQITYNWLDLFYLLCKDILFSALQPKKKSFFAISNDSFRQYFDMDPTSNIKVDIKPNTCLNIVQTPNCWSLMHREMISCGIYMYEHKCFDLVLDQFINWFLLLLFLYLQ